MKIYDLIKCSYYNKHLLFYVIRMFKDNWYVEIQDFCDNFEIIYRELSKEEFSEQEYSSLEKLDNIVKLYSPFDSDLEVYEYYTNDKQVISWVQDCLVKLDL